MIEISTKIGAISRLAGHQYARLDPPDEPLNPVRLTWSVPPWFHRDLVDGWSGFRELDLMYKDTVDTLARGIPDVMLEPEPHDLLGFEEAWRLEKISRNGGMREKKRPES